MSNHKHSPTTVIIKTIGRNTLPEAINSALREGFPVIVVFDGPSNMLHRLPKYKKDKVEIHCLGRRWGHFGNMAANVGVAFAKTKYITFLDDDDEFKPGAGNIIRKKLKQKPNVDIWIAGVEFVNSVTLKTPEGVISTNILANQPSLGVTPGNVAMPTYKTSIFETKPFVQLAQDEALTDFAHVDWCHKSGCKVDWFGEALYLVRPLLKGSNGGGV